MPRRHCDRINDRENCAGNSAATTTVHLLLGLLLLGTLPRAAKAGDADARRGRETSPKTPKEDFQYYSLVYDICLDRCHTDGCASVKVPHSGVTISSGGCVSACERGGPKDRAAPREFPRALRLLRWDCESDCKYRCMQTLQTVRFEEGLEAAKYYGKWSFRRVWGVQEIVSCLASLANAGVHAWYLPALVAAAAAATAGVDGGDRIREEGGDGGGGYKGGEDSGGDREGGDGGGGDGGGGDGGGGGRMLSSSYPRPRPRPRPSFAALWLLNAAVNLNGWVWSAVFHARDTPWTHFMDYAGANAIFFFALFAAVVRANGWRLRLQPGEDLARWAPLAAALLLLLTLHVRHVTTPTKKTRYNYDFNMRVMVVCATGHWATLLAWAYAYRPWWWRSMEKNKLTEKMQAGARDRFVHISAGDVRDDRGKNDVDEMDEGKQRKGLGGAAAAKTTTTTKTESEITNKGREQKKIEEGGAMASMSTSRARHPGRHALAMCCVSWHVAALAEVLDFPPWRGLLDAHALWHCATPACCWLWYRFVAADLALSAADLSPSPSGGGGGNEKQKAS